MENVSGEFLKGDRQLKKPKLVVPCTIGQGGRGALKLLSVTYIHNVSTPILAEFKPFFDNMRGFSHV